MDAFRRLYDWIRSFVSLRADFKSWFLLAEDQSSRNPAMEGMRAFAVLSVFLVHALGTYLSSHLKINADTYLSRFVAAIEELDSIDKVLLFLQRSHLGVDLFFLLSGYLICRSASRIQRFSAYRQFLWRRFLRIYPPFFLSLILCMILYIHVLHWQRFSFWQFAGNAMLLYGCPNLLLQAYNYVSWSLFWEIAFYIISPVQFVLTRIAFGKSLWQLPAALGLFTVSCLFLSYQPRVAMFYYGVLLALASQEQLELLAARLQSALVVGIYVAVESCFRLLPTSFGWFTPLYGLAASLLFVKVCFGKGWLARRFAWLPLRFVGNISYSFYLLHTPCIAIAWYVSTVTNWPIGRFGGISAFLGLAMLFSLIVSMGSFLLTERWYFTNSRKHRAYDPVPVQDEAFVPRQAA